MSPAQDIARLLAASSYGTVGTTIFVGTEPEAPAECITVYDLAGGEVETDEMDVFNPAAQVRVRSASYQTGYDLSTAIRSTLLSQLQYVGSSGRRYYGFGVTADVAPLMRDDNDRFVFVASYRSTSEE